MAVGSANHFNKNPDNVARILEALPEGTLIDTAEKYGEGKTEGILGQAIRQTELEWGKDVFCSTKYAPDVMRRSAGDVVKACQGSIQQLGCSQIDLYQAHFASSMLEHIVPILPKIQLRRTRYTNIKQNRKITVSAQKREDHRSPKITDHAEDHRSHITNKNPPSKTTKKRTIFI